MYFKELDLMIIELESPKSIGLETSGKSWSCRIEPKIHRAGQQATNSGKMPKLQSWSRIPSSSENLTFCSLKFLSDWIWPTHIFKSSNFYLKTTDFKY